MKTLNSSPAIDLIWRLAANEMAAGEFKEILPEHFCMALLKLAEMPVNPPQDIADPPELAKVICFEAQSLRELLQKRGIESTIARRKLRGHMGRGGSPFTGGKIHRSAASRTLFRSAATLAYESGEDTVKPLHLLKALMEAPTSAITLAVQGKAPPTPAPAPVPLIETHGQGLVKQDAARENRVKPGLDARAQGKAVIQALCQKDRKSVLLVSDSDDLVAEVAAALASTLAGKDAPYGLRMRRLVDASAKIRLAPSQGISQSRRQGQTDLERLRQVLSENASHPEVILLVPAVEAAPSQAHEGRWASLLEETLAKGAVQLICRVKPSLFNDHLRKAPIWKRKAHAIWLEELTEGSVPREL